MGERAGASRTSGSGRRKRGCICVCRRVVAVAERSWVGRHRIYEGTFTRRGKCWFSESNPCSRSASPPADSPTGSCRKEFEIPLGANLGDSAGDPAGTARSQGSNPTSSNVGCGDQHCSASSSYQSRGGRTLPEGTIFLEQAYARRSEQGRRFFHASDRSRSELCPALCGPCRLL